jgi:hypothetical protein
MLIGHLEAGRRLRFAPSSGESKRTAVFLRALLHVSHIIRLWFKHVESRCTLACSAITSCATSDRRATMSSGNSSSHSGASDAASP